MKKAKDNAEAHHVSSITRKKQRELNQEKAKSRLTDRLQSRTRKNLNKNVVVVPKLNSVVVPTTVFMVEEETEEEDDVKATTKIENVDEVVIAVKNEKQPENDGQATLTVDKVDKGVAVKEDTATVNVAAVVKKKAKKSKKMPKVVKTTKIVEKAKKKTASAGKRNDTVVSLTAQKDRAIAKEDYQEAERLRKKIAEQEASQNEKIQDIKVKQVKTDAVKAKSISKEEARVRSMLQKAGTEKCKLLFKHNQKLSGSELLNGDLLFKKMFSRLKMARVDFDLMLLRLDNDNDGCLSLDEFICWLKNE